MNPETQPRGQRKHVDGHSWCPLLPEVHARERTALQAVGVSDMKCRELKPRFANYWRGLCCPGRKVCMLWLLRELLAKSCMLPWMPLHCCSGCCTVRVRSHVAATLLKLKNTCVSMCRWLRCSSLVSTSGGMLVLGDTTHCPQLAMHSPSVPSSMDAWWPAVDSYQFLVLYGLSSHTLYLLSSHIICQGYG